MNNNYRGIIAIDDKYTNRGDELVEELFKEFDNIECIKNKVKCSINNNQYIFFESTDNINVDTFNSLLEKDNVLPLVFDQEAYEKWEENDFGEIEEPVGLELLAETISTFALVSI